MDYTDGTQRAYDIIAEEYAQDHANDTWDNDYLELFSSLLPPAADVLDLGCGPGVEIKRLRIRGFHVHGLDISARILAVAKRLNPDSPFTRGDMRKLPFGDGTFNGVFAKASLLHISKGDATAVLNETRRVLVPSGIFHVAVPHKRPGQKDGTTTENVGGLPFTRFFSYWTAHELKEHLTNAGFTVTQSTETDDALNSTTWIKVIASRAK